MPEAFTLQFGEAAVRIECEDAEFSALIRRRFRHCLAESPVVEAVTYRIAAAGDGRWDLKRDKRPVLHYAHAWRLPDTLMQDMTIHLTAHTRHSLVFHAGGVVHQGGGLMLCGGTGSGKSTLAAWLVCQGFQFLGDEIIALDPERLEMSGFPRPIVLKKGSEFIYQGRTGDAAPDQVETFPNQTTWVDPAWLGGGEVLRRAPLRALVFPRYQPGEEFQAERLSAAEAAFQLMQHLVNGRNLPGEGFATAVGIASRYPAYRLLYGSLTDAAFQWFATATD